MKSIFEKFNNKILFEQPITYLGLTTYPILMKDVFTFYNCIGVLLINPLDFNDPDIASLSYLELILGLCEVQEDFEKNFIELLCLAFHVEQEDIDFETRIEDEETLVLLKIKQDGKWKEISSSKFSKIKDLICYQNGQEIRNLNENQEIAKARQALAAKQRRLRTSVYIRPSLFSCCRNENFS